MCAGVADDFPLVGGEVQQDFFLRSGQGLPEVGADALGIYWVIDWVVLWVALRVIDWVGYFMGR